MLLSKFSPEEIEQEQEIALWEYPYLSGYEGIIACARLVSQDKTQSMKAKSAGTMQLVQDKNEDSRQLPECLSIFDRYILEVFYSEGLSECARLTGETIPNIDKYIRSLINFFIKPIST